MFNWLIKKSCEPTYPENKNAEYSTIYVSFFGKRLIFKEGKYIGWYKP